ncbi:hypothetical protein JOC85_001305 [Bacillus mesophilus]|uniref:DUF2953 domain-containing protein n=1 Tax=Bacillus mesophilus TaxID=1808955 RepID=A0A6M0QA27_9BACI|nr:DUF2953 domain-containing protein [Bacillus mesophilus]MBM7660533.1 hypothetical protein [Bacillus mesophilus]NEY71918.1 DUF2953 domain-containing protein [Bacillus mesophilus]
MIWYFILSGILMLLFFIFISELHIKIDYVHAQDNDQLSIMLRLWFFRFTIKVPLIKVDKDSNSVVFEQEIQTGSPTGQPQEKPKDVTSNELVNGFKNIKEIIEHVVGLHKIVRAFLKKVTVHKLEWHSNLGLGDAALTGMLVGAGWTIKGSIIGVLSQYMILKTSPTVTITPFFQQTFSHTKLSCMLSFRIGNAILAGLRIVKYWKGGLPSFAGGPSFLKSKNSEKSI